MATQQYIATITTFGFNFAPRGYAQCNGQILAIAQNSALFSLIGTFYGGNGVQNFALPDLRGRVPIHMGQGLGLSNYVIGQPGGAESVTLSIAQMPAHTHAFTGSGGTLTATTTKASAAAPAAGALLGRSDDTNAVALPQIYVPAASVGTTVALGGVNAAGSNALTGGSQPHPNIQPYLTLNVCIALQGIFPSRN